MKQFFKKADLLLILVLCVVGAALLLPRLNASGNLECVVYERGEEIHRVALGKVTQGYTLPLDGPPAMVVFIENDGARFQSSDCTDKLCVKAGKLTRRGDTAACLPGRVLVTIQGSEKGDNEPDILTY